MITKKQKLQALDESILLQEVVMKLWNFKAYNEISAMDLAEDIIKLVREGK